MSIVNPVVSLPPSGAEGEKIALQLGSILQSGAFRNSPTQQRLLQYVVQEATTGQSRDLKEYNIGVAVFQRGHQFDPRTDSIVRVQMGLLRKRLAAYYQKEGSEDTLLIEIPKGRYLPTFAARQPGATAPEPGIVEPTPKEPARHFLRGKLWWSLAALGVLLAAFLLLHRPGANEQTSSPPAKTAGFIAADHPLWKGFLASNQRTLLLVGAPLFVNLPDGLYVRDSRVNEPEQIAKSKRMTELGATAPRTTWSTEIYTGIGEVMGVSLLTRFFAHSHSDLPLLRNRLARWQDVTDGNLILLASLRFHTLNRELELPSDFQLQDMAHRVPSIHNLKPHPGEENTYAPQMTDGTTGTDYAVVSVWPGTLPGRRIMKIGGCYTWGTQGAAEYLVDPPSLQRLDDDIKKAPGGWQEGIPLQILLKVNIRENQVVSAKYVTHHWLTPDRQ
jgi:hypothetical protein